MIPSKNASSTSKKKSTIVGCLLILILILVLFGLFFSESRYITTPTILNSIGVRSIRIDTILPRVYTIVPQINTNATTIIRHVSHESFICDSKSTNRFPVSSTTQTTDSFDQYRRNNLQKYCDIVPIPRNNWSPPISYTEKDVAFVIFTASSFFHTRATATRDTWLSRVSNYYFLSATPYPYLPVTVVPGAGENKLSNMKKLFYGLQIIYKQQMNLPVDQRQKWFYIIGCDTFILPHHLLKRINGLDYRQPIRVGGHWGHCDCPGPNGTRFQGEFPSGGAGFFFSMKLLEILQPHLTNYVENVWPRDSEVSDVALSCLAHQLGVTLTKQVGFWAHAPDFTLAENGRARFHKESEPNDFHYIKPDEMYALDEFYFYQHMDRLVNDQKWNELVQFTRRFAASHYELLRKKRRECTLPTVEPEVKTSN